MIAVFYFMGILSALGGIVGFVSAVDLNAWIAIGSLAGGILSAMINFTLASVLERLDVIEAKLFGNEKDESSGATAFEETTAEVQEENQKEIAEETEVGGIGLSKTVFSKIKPMGALSADEPSRDVHIGGSTNDELY